MLVTSNRPPDPLQDALRACGLAVTDHTLSGHAGSLYIGPRFRIHHCEIIYRRPESGLLLVVLYRRLADRTRTLANPFADLLWFLRLCTRPEFDLCRILCCVSTDRYRDQNGLTDARMARFCRHVLGASWIQYDGHPWLYRDVEPLRAQLKRMERRTTYLELASPVRFIAKKESKNVEYY